MHINKFRGIVRKKLGPGRLLKEKGRVLYSSVHSLREWRTGVYVLGLDPGGTPDDHKSIGDDIQRNEMNERGYCVLIKERWNKCEMGEHPYEQHALQALRLRNASSIVLLSYSDTSLRGLPASLSIGIVPVVLYWA
jgi:hypothetical protein